LYRLHGKDEGGRVKTVCRRGFDDAHDKTYHAVQATSRPAAAAAAIQGSSHRRFDYPGDLSVGGLSDSRVRRKMTAGYDWNDVSAPARRNSVSVSCINLSIGDTSINTHY
jgi:hypothetical protein